MIYSKITEGDTPGHINFIAGSTHYGETWDSATRTLSSYIERYMNNNSGGDIDIGEIGIIASSQQAYDYFDAMFSRDVLDPKETFYDGAQLYIRYTFQLVYPPFRFEKSGTAKARIETSFEKTTTAKANISS